MSLFQALFFCCIAVGASESSAQVWRIVDRSSSEDPDQWVVHQINFFEHYVVLDTPGDNYAFTHNAVPRCFGPLRPHYNDKLNVISSGYHKEADATFRADNAFQEHVGTPWKSNPFSASSGTSAWIGATFSKNVTVRCIEIYQSRPTRSTKYGMNGFTTDVPVVEQLHLALESESPSNVFSQEEEWNYEWSPLRDHRVEVKDGWKSMWMTLAVGVPAQDSYTECGFTDVESANCCVWPDTSHADADASSARGIQQFQIGTDESNPKCTPGATVKAGTRCNASSTLCPGFKGFIQCVNNEVLIEPLKSWAVSHLDPRSQDECGKKLEMSLKSGSRLVTNHDGHVILAQYDDDNLSEAEEAFEESFEEEEDDWDRKLLHDFSFKVAYIIVGVVVMLCFVGHIARKLRQQSNPLQRLHDEPEAPQTEKAMTIGSPSNRNAERIDSEEVVVDIRS